MVIQMTCKEFKDRAESQPDTWVQAVRDQLARLGLCERDTPLDEISFTGLVSLEGLDEVH